MDQQGSVEEPAGRDRSRETARSRERADYASRAADLATERYARDERERRRESLEEFLSREHSA
ncbi:MAG TPA: hypothetical protein VFH17_04975 [Coriobacteriia bacterium]|nr:hypothetical protein [Coriobacteriia bacterium]